MKPEEAIAEIKRLQELKGDNFNVELKIDDGTLQSAISESSSDSPIFYTNHQGMYDLSLLDPEDLVCVVDVSPDENPDISPERDVSFFQVKRLPEVFEYARIRNEAIFKKEKPPPCHDMRPRECDELLVRANPKELYFDDEGFVKIRIDLCPEGFTPENMALFCKRANTLRRKG